MPPFPSAPAQRRRRGTRLGDVPVSRRVPRLREEDRFMDELVATRRIGEAVVAVISDGTLRWAPKFPISEDERRRAIPDAGEDGRVTLGLNLAHVRLGNASIVIDPGCDEPASAWAREFAAKWPGLERSPGLAEALRCIRVAPEDVTHVLITHVHEDHLAGVAREDGGALALRFPNARHIVGRRDWEEHPARQQPDSALVRRLGLAAGRGLLDTVDRDREIAPGVTMLTTPGETPGHCAVRVDSGGRRFYYLGDLFHLACEVEHVDWAPPNRDTAALAASRRRLLEDQAGHDSVLVFTHNRFPAWGRIVRAGAAYRWMPD
jgi:glyoxylase-like metal-dependent hydrolase (beta-lactamase superfamily II)